MVVPNTNVNVLDHIGSNRINAVFENVPEFRSVGWSYNNEKRSCTLGDMSGQLTLAHASASKRFDVCVIMVVEASSISSF